MTPGTMKYRVCPGSFAVGSRYEMTHTHPRDSLRDRDGGMHTNAQTGVHSRDIWGILS